MRETLELEGERTRLRSVDLEDATEYYVAWLNDPEVNQYLETRFREQTTDSAKEYIRKKIEDPDTLFLAIIRRDTQKHIGNIKLGPINRDHRYAEMSLVVGDKASWGKGFGSEAIGLLTDYAFGTLGLHKIIAGAYENNTASIKAFLKCGFEKESVRKKQYYYKDAYVDAIVMTRFNENSG
ncbi:hypothetical protein A3A39_02405 [Candidatus Kaiserbacteria bacterium RIFCSPLOWO2_01_FULL_54_13]|uniref:N-acetyltransferase domain-containing protein n=1 Tax=Candidatus Kaiserbacteria bacterium RIFCSPLOWO2_01_FULL_54_13 TaxID=1798512 RepID=A0A1F6F123_9BACT|nr:MAG: hypothetical protein A3A39_02405 [Candidatus Kaiserbacteria bacterium RIFCSPLOWO2_01_FULL_54_13]